MTDFKVGDKVRYTGGTGSSVSHNWVGIEGVVTEDKGTFVYMKITKVVPGSKTYVEGFEIWPYKENLELITEEKPLTFKDIRKGDLIRRTIIRSDGSKVIWEGVANRKNFDGTSWLSADNYHLYYKEDDVMDGHSLELLERPEPPHWSETKPVGSIFLYNTGSNKALWKKVMETHWKRTFLTNDITNSYTNKEVERWVTEEVEWLK